MEQTLTPENNFYSTFPLCKLGVYLETQVCGE